MQQHFEVPPIQMHVEVLQDENATVVKLVDHRGKFTTGSSKRAPGDPKNYPLGMDLAIARAMVKHGMSILQENGAL